VEDIEHVALKVHPLVLELTGKTSPRNGLEGKFSVYHACAAAIMFGQAAESEFSDAVVARPDVVALRERVSARVDPALDEDAADVTIGCRDGRELHLFVAHAIGSLERPMSDADLERKFRGLVEPVLGGERAEALIERCAAVAECPELGFLTALARPGR
jgi:2-methylcitrate dehydratase PrpD